MTEIGSSRQENSPSPMDTSTLGNTNKHVSKLSVSSRFRRPATTGMICVPNFHDTGGFRLHSDADFKNPTCANSIADAKRGTTQHTAVQSHQYCPDRPLHAGPRSSDRTEQKPWRLAAQSDDEEIWANRGLHASSGHKIEFGKLSPPAELTKKFNELGTLFQILSQLQGIPSLAKHEFDMLREQLEAKVSTAKYWNVCPS